MIASNDPVSTADPVDILEESVAIASTGKSLAGVLAYPLMGAPRQAALVIGPHPLMGGRLENNVVRAVSRGLAEHGLIALRFAFAGAGPTAETMDAFWRTGRAPDDPVRIDEARAAARWLKRLGAETTVLVGYSFGASLLTGLVGELPVTHVALISPTLAQHDFDDMARLPLAKLVVTARNDFATPLAVVDRWFAGCVAPKSLVVFESAEHFFRGQEDRLVSEIVTWLRS